MAKAHKAIARSGNIIVESKFRNYDVCINPYVGCEFGCSYCYVREFIKDPNHDWGEFVRIREHIQDKLPKELNKGYYDLIVYRETVKDSDGHVVIGKSGKPKRKSIKARRLIKELRLVIGTMTDPYQPAEKNYRITRQTLEILLKHTNKFSKVGIFTRSPLILQDLELIKKLPRAQIHFTITPFPHDILRAIEPYSTITERRWQVVEELVKSGIRVHVNVSPIIPKMSEQFIKEFVEKLIKLQVNEYFVDPMQPYKSSFDAFQKACHGHPSVNWQEIQAIMQDKIRYLQWKADFFSAWQEARQPLQHLAPNQLPIWSDHENKIWMDMRTCEDLDKNHYGDG